MPRNDGTNSGSDSEGSGQSFHTANSGGSTSSNSSYVSVSGSSSTGIPQVVTPTQMAAAPTVAPPGDDVSFYDVEAAAFRSVDRYQNWAVYRWSQKAGEWAHVDRESAKQFAIDAVPLILQAGGKGYGGQGGGYANDLGVGLGGLKNVYQGYNAVQNYVATKEPAYLYQTAAATVGLGGAVLSGYGNSTSLSAESQGNWQAAGAGLQAGSATWQYTSPTAQQQPAATTPVPVTQQQQPQQQSADAQQPPIQSVGRPLANRQDSMATGNSRGGPRPVRRTTTHHSSSSSSTSRRDSHDSRGSGSSGGRRTHG
ncbi:hypothetical protein [Streptomyces sp. NPDC101455]|uniref:hypothetical protein n=1 Tax=Streptomyces sp. NPDC101455 TaxID=3366142 RepID=UPI0038227ACF